jgi:hypothetical protein
MVSQSIRDFFTASASVAGALIGLLFVALSVAASRLREGEDGQLHRIRASAALTAFTNSLSVSLFALIPGHKIGWTAVSVAVAGLAFVLASLLSLVRLRKLRWRTVRDVLFLAVLALLFVYQLIQGLDVLAQPGDAGAVGDIAIVVVVCFLIGIGRAWELIGGPLIGIRHEVTALVRSYGNDADDPPEEQPSPRPGGSPRPIDSPRPGGSPAAPRG